MSNYWRKMNGPSNPYITAQQKFHVYEWTLAMPIKRSHFETGLLRTFA